MAVVAEVDPSTIEFREFGPGEDAFKTLEGGFTVIPYYHWCEKPYVEYNEDYSLKTKADPKTGKQPKIYTGHYGGRDFQTGEERNFSANMGTDWVVRDEDPDTHRGTTVVNTKDKQHFVKTSPYGSIVCRAIAGDSEALELMKSAGRNDPRKFSELWEDVVFLVGPEVSFNPSTKENRERATILKVIGFGSNLNPEDLPDPLEASTEQCKIQFPKQFEKGGFWYVDEDGNAEESSKPATPKPPSTTPSSAGKAAGNGAAKGSAGRVGTPTSSPEVPEEFMSQFRDLALKHPESQDWAKACVKLDGVMDTPIMQWVIRDTKHKHAALRIEAQA